LDFYKRMTRLFVKLDHTYSRRDLIKEFKVSFICARLKLEKDKV
jgi:hypothetical protein